MRQTILEFEDGAVSHSLVKVKIDDLEEWDATHDATGKRITSNTTTEELGAEEEYEIKV
jgi:hypothetical protein